MLQHQLSYKKNDAHLDACTFFAILQGILYYEIIFIKHSIRGQNVFYVHQHHPVSVKSTNLN